MIIRLFQNNFYVIIGSIYWVLKVYAFLRQYVFCKVQFIILKQKYV